MSSRSTSSVVGRCYPPLMPLQKVSCAGRLFTIKRRDINLARKTPFRTFPSYHPLGRGRVVACFGFLEHGWLSYCLWNPSWSLFYEGKTTWIRIDNSILSCLSCDCCHKGTRSQTSKYPYITSVWYRRQAGTIVETKRLVQGFWTDLYFIFQWMDGEFEE